MVAIKDLEMPNECSVCLLYEGENTHCKGGCFIPYFFGDSENKKHSDCPLVEIITCKDCKYYRNKDGDEWCTNHSIGDNKFLVREDYHCADAERREKMAEHVDRKRYMKDKYNCDLLMIEGVELVPLYQIIDKLEQSVPAVPLDRIKEAREEMVNGMPSIRTEGQLTGEDVVFSTACECYAECIMILDKLIAEVEGMNEAD